MTEPMTAWRLQEIRLALTELAPNISNATDLLDEVDRLRAALNAPLLHSTTAGYVHVLADPEPGPPFDFGSAGAFVYPDVGTARAELAQTDDAGWKVFAIMDLSLFGDV